MKKPLIDYEAFLMGIKPALLASTNVPNHLENMHLFKKYPHIKENISPHNKADFFLFFQTESMKKDFLEKMNKVEPLSPEFHEILGIALGFPPLAVKHFVKCNRLEKVEKRLDEFEKQLSYKVSFIYSGIRCGGHVDDLVENSVWLWEKYYIKDEPFKVGFLIGSVVKYFDIKPYDFAELEKVKQLKLKTIEETCS
ncbi:MAG: hypothetical protein WB502_11095 [Thermoactinomyces sp.]